MMELVTAMVIGLAGSLHCIGMCGPIVLALPQSGRGKLEYWAGRILYNSGRVVTYAVIGFFCGHIGEAIFAGGYQRTLSITLGVLILLYILIPSNYAARFLGARLHLRAVLNLKSLWNRLLIRKSIGSLFIIGLLNGFLPCGLVYIALAGALATGDPLKGALFMALFGLGTIPVMLATALAGKILKVNLKRQLRRLIPIGGVILAMLFILRGMSLGIPYLSPKFEAGIDGRTRVSCCHPDDKEAPPIN